MPVCCVYKCSNPSGHRFPKNVELRKKWVVAIKREESFVIGDRTIVCYEHFLPEDYTTECKETGKINTYCVKQNL